MRRRRRGLTPAQILGSRPVRAQNLRTEELEDGGLRLVAQRPGNWWLKLLGVIVPIPRERRIELDWVGKQVWQLCDGEHTLRDMIAEFQRNHKLTRAEAEWSLRSYLRDLGKRGLVAFVVEASEEPKSRGVEESERR
jgi:hypothetical protein